MGWREFQSWLGAMNRQNEPATVTPDSWAGADQDPEWQRMRAVRDAANRA